jgi:hypothetical protein
VVSSGEFYSSVLIPPHSEQSHTRGSFRCIGTSEAGLLFCWNRLFFCSVSYGSRTIRRNEPTPTGDGVVVLEPFILLFRFAGFRTIRTNGLLGCSISRYDFHTPHRWCFFRAYFASGVGVE